MSRQVVTVQVDNERLTFYAEDWPRMKRAIEKGIAEGGKQTVQRPAHHSLISAVAIEVAEKSRLAPGVVA